MNDGGDRKRQFQGLEKGLHFGLTVAVATVLLVLIGIKVDDHFGTGPLFTVLFTVWGFAGSFVWLYRKLLR